MSNEASDVRQTDPRLAALAQLIASEREVKKRPLERWHPSRTADIGLRITADGVWHYRESPIERPALVRLFASILRREADGVHYLVTPVEKVIVAVEDAPLLAVEMWVEGEGAAQALSFRTNLDDIILCGPDQPIRFAPDPTTGAPKPYLGLRHGLEALATRAVYLEIVEHGSIETAPAGRSFGVWSREAFFPMAPAEAVE
jgi:hypothetical protein